MKYIFTLTFLGFAIMLSVLNLIGSEPTPILDIGASGVLILFGMMGDILFMPAWAHTMVG